MNCRHISGSTHVRNGPSWEPGLGLDGLELVGLGLGQGPVGLGLDGLRGMELGLRLDGLRVPELELRLDGLGLDGLGLDGLRGMELGLGLDGLELGLGLGLVGLGLVGLRGMELGLRLGGLRVPELELRLDGLGLGGQKLVQQGLLGLKLCGLELTLGLVGIRLQVSVLEVGLRLQVLCALAVGLRLQVLCALEVGNLQSLALHWPELGPQLLSGGAILVAVETLLLCEPELGPQLLAGCVILVVAETWLLFGPEMRLLGLARVVWAGAVKMRGLELRLNPSRSKHAALRPGQLVLLRRRTLVSEMKLGLSTIRPALRLPGQCRWAEPTNSRSK